MQKRTKALAIPISVKKAVAQRDAVDGWPCCVYCGIPAPTEAPLAFSNAHYIARSQGGLGIEKNTLTLCPICHKEYDQSPDAGKRQYLKEIFKNYLSSIYKNWREEDLVYKKNNEKIT